MEERIILTQDDVLDLIGKDLKSFPEQPMFNKVIVTLNVEELDGNLVLSENVLSDIQYVVAAGETARVIPGQKIRLDLEKLMVNVGSANNNSYEPVKELKLDFIEVDGKQYAIVEDRYIKTKINY